LLGQIAFEEFVNFLLCQGARVRVAHNIGIPLVAACDLVLLRTLPKADIHDGRNGVNRLIGVTV
jgi:hypothetical protein